MDDVKRAKAQLSKAWARLLDEIESEARDTATWTGRKRFSDRVMAAMASVPRHRFVPAHEAAAAYINRPRPQSFTRSPLRPCLRRSRRVLVWSVYFRLHGEPG